jgi:LmbE family N-acetylglucosaminyl deacetylase/diadenosine tetraphosphate (Ap4A) HIT family hydrolase
MQNTATLQIIPTEMEYFVMSSKKLPTRNHSTNQSLKRDKRNSNESNRHHPISGKKLLASDGVSYAETENDVPHLNIEEKLKTPLQLDENGEPFLVVQRIATTKAFNKDTQLWDDQAIVCVMDPLGINGETQVGQKRTERPKSEAHPGPAARLDEATFKALFPIFAHPDNEWLLSALVEGIDNSNILGWLYTQLDTIADRKRVENLKKKILLNPFVPQDILFNTCIFCNVKPGRIIDSLGQTSGVVSINNDYPFAPIMHKVLILQERKHDITEITADEVSSFYEMFYKIAITARNEFGESLDGCTYGMNYGLARIYKGKQVIPAGASQPHLHTQVAGLSKSSFNAGDRIGLLCRAYHEKHQRDYLEDYIHAISQANLLLHEDDHAVLYIPIAQRFNFEVQIMVKDRAVGNILDTTPEIRKSLGRLEHLTYMMYQNEELSIQSFNTVMYATRFSAKNNYGQRLVVSIYPRTTIMALSELAGRNVVDSFPWDAAAALRGSKERGMTMGPRKLSILVIGAHPDDIELGCGGTIAELERRNHGIHALIVTDGCGGKDRIPEEREGEANDAAKVLGIRSVSFGRIRDGQAHPSDTLYDLVETQIKRHKPDVVIAHGNIASEHNDHKNVSEVVKTLCARQTPRIYPLMFEVPAYKEDSSFRPSLYVDIGSSIDTKKAAIEKHRSEIDRGTIKLDEVERRAKLRGNEIDPGITYAEAFMCDAPPRERASIIELMPFMVMR